jgi:DNA-directed RNA polymerase II subunit RPB1
MEHKFKNSNADVKIIKGIQFGVISPEYIKAISVTQAMEYAGKEIARGITIDNSYDQVSGQANLGAINDPRMGNTGDLEHPGYFGHIELVIPVYHIGFLKIVIDILKCVSYYTSELLVSRDNYTNKKGRRNLKEITHASKSIKKCPVTEKKLPTYTKEGTKIGVDFGQGKDIISSDDVYHILEKISNEDAIILGFDPKVTRPEWLLLKTIPVPPLHVRPSVFMSSSQKCDDDLTTKLTEIVKTNLALTKAIENNKQDQTGGNNHYISQIESLLQYNVNTFIDNQHPGQPPSLQRSGKPLKTIRERLSSKDGRVRGNLMGKRVDFCGRTVITADPNLSIDEVGVPINIARNLTIPETVTDYNKDKLLELVRRGPNQYPGAKFIIKNGTKLDLKFVKITELKNGWVIERHLCDGDFILFNRQPSLHKMSIMGHKVRVLNKSTFRLNLAVTSPYNADFDGDEMNLHVPQSLTARTEIENIMMVDRLIVSPQSNRPVIGIIQDSLLSSCKMSRRNAFVTKPHLLNILTIIDWDGNIPTPAIIKYDMKGVCTELWTGKQIISLIVPKTMNMNTLKDQMNINDKGILIRNGNILSGSVDKSVIGKSNGGLIHILFNDYGPVTTKIFLNKIQKLSNYWIKHIGFTIGIGDAVASPQTVDEVNKILSDMKNKIAKEVDNNTDKDPKVIEEFINAELNAAVDEAGKKAEESLNFDNNNFKATVSAGSKGSNINISQIMVAVGQQNVEGRRINYGFKNRTLPHFDKFDIGQESRGFVENSYLTGLTPQEFFFHAMSGREGLIDTA